MMKQLLPILKLLSLTLSFSVSATPFELTEGTLWSVDGGVFQSTSSPGNVNEILVKDLNGEIKLIKNNRTKQTLSPFNKSIIIDQTGPTISTQWTGTVLTNNSITIGPHSQLKLEAEGGQLTQLLLDQKQQQIMGSSHLLTFDESINSITATARDAFENISTLKINLTADFTKPTYNWKLATPALKKHSTWYASNDAELQLETQDPSGIKNVTLNGQPVVYKNETFVVQNGDNISITDTLGNTANETLQWEQDAAPPKIKISVNGQEVSIQKRNQVKVNDLITIYTEDSGVGVKTQQYKGVKKRWKPLPKTVRFINKGNFSIKIFTEDNVGNKLETILKFKVKR